MKKIILIGTGNLGKRYLQAILKADRQFSCFCFDISTSAVEEIIPFLSKNGIQLDKLTIMSSFDDILKIINEESLVIIASTANDRLGMLKKITARKPEAFIIEKPVAQTEEDFRQILNNCESRNIPAWVHYTLRFQPFGKTLKTILEGERNYDFFSWLPEMGIACVSIHYIDFFMWLFSIRDFEITDVSCQGVYEQKRKGFYDMYGELTLRTAEGNTGRFINSSVEGIRTMVILLKGKVISVFEDQRITTILNKSDSKIITSIEAQYDFTSNYMKRIMENYIDGNINITGELVSLNEAQKSHQVIYDYMRLTKNKNLNIT